MLSRGCFAVGSFFNASRFLPISRIKSPIGTIVVKNKCLFVKNFDPKKINFEKPNNIVVLNAECGNVIIELYPEVSPNGVERFITL